MIKHFCDRCGKEVEDDELIVNKLGCKPSLMLYTDLYDERISLCPDCQKDLMQWVRDAKEKSGIIPPAVELVQPMREKIKTLTRIGNNMHFVLQGMTSDIKSTSPEMWLRLGQLMQEWNMEAEE